MSDSPAFLELERLVRHLGEDLASYRRRAIAAEARLRDVDREAAERDGGVRDVNARPSRAPISAKGRGHVQTSLGLDGAMDGDTPDEAFGEPAGEDGERTASAADGAAAGARVGELEVEVAMLRQRLEVATARTRAMLERVRFLRQQRQEVPR